MRTPGTAGHLLPIAVPGFLVVGALLTLVLPTFLGALLFSGPVWALLFGVLTGTLVWGYVLAGAQSTLSGRLGPWTLPPEALLAPGEASVTVAAYAVERAGFSARADHVTMPLGHALALERALAGAWGTPEGVLWDRIAYVQRLVLALGTSAVFAVLFIAGDVASGGVSRGVRDHAGPVLLLGALGSWLLARLVVRMRQEAVVELLADARALLLDRGENTEVQRVLQDLDLVLAEEDLGVAL